jgi:concanavalin A-like lectin/glucanase superfamily protein
MWQLFCHHTYKCDGRAIDLSPFDNDGTVTNKDFEPDGAGSETGALRFTAQDSRVVVPARKNWQVLGALRIEALARVDSGHNALRIIALGDQSFSFGLDSDGYLIGAVFGLGPTCRSDGAGAPDGHARKVPTDRWLSLGMVYDGLGQIGLTIDGHLVARAYAPGTLHNVVGRGLAIGNAHDHPGGGPLIGAIDEIQLWRYHPNSVLDEFCARPAAPSVGTCWEKWAGQLNDVLAKDADCAQALRLAIADLVSRTRLAMGALSPERQLELNALLQSYLGLWESGQVDGAAMATVIGRIADFFRNNGVDIAHDPAFGAFLKSSCMAKVEAALGGDCDPEFRSLIELIVGALGLSLPPASGGH